MATNIPSSSTKSVTIIGAGLSGLTLALTLHSHGISSKIYELRQARLPASTIGGAIMTSPNALRVLDTLGLYSSLKTQGYNFERLNFKTPNHKTIDSFYFGSERLYGYKALRIARSILLDSLKTACGNAGIEIVYDQRFSYIVSESAESVTYAIIDGSQKRQETTSILIGADGIHSTVRKYLYPNIIPVYQNFIGVTSTVPKSALRFPSSSQSQTTSSVTGPTASDLADYDEPSAISTAHGAFVMAPQNADGSEVFVGRQIRHVPDHDRAGWDALTADKHALLSMFQQDQSMFPDLAQSGMEGVKPEHMNIWPFYKMPSLDAGWTSQSGRVILIGDAAHALPPTTGQGANQAVEDAYQLGIVLERFLVRKAVDLKPALEKWQSVRQVRVKGIETLTRLMDNRRLPLAEQEALGEGEVWKGRGEREMEWLFGADLRGLMVDALDAAKA